jgi:hypothetical protein
MLCTAAMVGLLAALTTASPIEKRVPPTDIDGTILNYALTLEYLERRFYTDGVARFNNASFMAAGFDAAFYANMLEVAKDEQTHVAFLHDALVAAGVQPTNELEYTFPYTDAKSFVTLATVLEGVGVSAYLGAANLITDPDYLTAAGAILTIEARHASYLRAAAGESPFPTPFDTPLGLNAVYSLAAQFITGGSSPVSLPVMAFPPISLKCSHFYYQADRSSVTFTNAYKNAAAMDSSITKDTPVYAVFYSGLVPTAVPVKITRGNKDYKVDTLPAGIAGQVYVTLSKSATDFGDDNVISGVGLIEVYPKNGQPAGDGSLVC